MIIDCPSCGLRVSLYATEWDVGSMWCSRCRNDLKWDERGELCTSFSGPKVGDLDGKTLALVGVGRDEAVVVEVRGPLAEFAMSLDTYYYFDESILDREAMRATDPGIYVWEGVLEIYDGDDPKQDFRWEYLDYLKDAGGWAVRPVGGYTLRPPTTDDGWRSLQGLGGDK